MLAALILLASGGANRGTIHVSRRSRTDHEGRTQERTHCSYQGATSVPLVSINTYVKAGYFDEDDRISGISHVIEHMFFKGTAKRPVGDIARETQALGGYLNAYTYYDRTVYHTEVPAENLKKALEIQADALWNSTYDATN